ncbi:MAG: hypothetical protein R3335_12995, partial [Anaerolineales bacterium]|nr:hypothetical protein [Anaerolineales bacterium]
MSHLNDEELRKLVGPDREAIDPDSAQFAHLAGCADCGRRMDLLQQRASWIEARMSSLEPEASDALLSADDAYRQITTRIAESSKDAGLIQGIIRAPRYRPVFAGVIAL